jgi:hypothetical protein|tara:strand:+ start:411 stop:968 length:558 start_codon:yes stop_codon:yes gene_type:complete
MVSLSAPLDFPTPERRKCRDENVLERAPPPGLVCFEAVLMRLDVDAFVAGVFAMGIFDVGVFDAGVFEIAAGVRPLVRLDVVLAEVVTESTDDFFERPLPRGQIPFLAFSKIVLHLPHPPLECRHFGHPRVGKGLSSCSLDGVRSSPSRGGGGASTRSSAGTLWANVGAGMLVILGRRSPPSLSL